MPTSERLEKLQQLLARSPNDTFLLYGMALEHKKLKDAAKAIELLDRVVQIDPAYCYAYHQKGLIEESTGNMEAAKSAYRAGIAAAQKCGDAHAQGEIQGALEMIDS